MTADINKLSIIPDLTDTELENWDDAILVLYLLRGNNSMAEMVQSLQSLSDDAIEEIDNRITSENTRRSIEKRNKTINKAIKDGTIDGVFNTNWRKIMALRAARLVKLIQLNAPSPIVDDAVNLIVQASNNTRSVE